MKTWDFPCSLIPGLWWDCLLRRWFVSGHIGCPTFSSLPITVVRNSILPYPFLQPCPFLAGDVIQATSPRQALSLAATFVNFFAICLPLYSTSIFMKKKMHADVLGLSWTDFAICLILLFFLWKKTYSGCYKNVSLSSRRKLFVPLNAIALPVRLLYWLEMWLHVKNSVSILFFNTQAIDCIFWWFSKTENKVYQCFTWLLHQTAELSCLFFCNCIFRTAHFTKFPINQSILAFII